MTAATPDLEKLRALAEASTPVPWRRCSASDDPDLREKLDSLRKRFGAGATLNRRDAEALDAIEAFYAGTCDERSALAVVDSAKRSNQARYRGRR